MKIAFPVNEKSIEADIYDSTVWRKCREAPEKSRGFDLQGKIGINIR